MIDSELAGRLEQLEQDRFRLIGQAAGYRLSAFNSIESLAPSAARVDMAVALVRYAREHWALTGAVLGIAGIALRKHIGMLALVQVALRLGSYLFAR